MNNDEIKGKAKDIAGRVQRQVGEWTGDTEAEVKGTVKQAEGKAQNAWGKAKEAVKKPAENVRPARTNERGDEPIEDKEENEKEESKALHRHTG